MKEVGIEVCLPGREELRLKMSLSETDEISGAKLTGIGGPDLLKLLGEWRPKLRGSLSDIGLPEGDGTAEILMRELLLRAKGEWQPPFTEEELCHCRAVATQIVDTAIIVGAHTPEMVSAQTSASTACGTCRPDVADMIKYRLGK